METTEMRGVGFQPCGPGWLLGSTHQVYPPGQQQEEKDRHPCFKGNFLETSVNICMSFAQAWSHH